MVLGLKPENVHVIFRRGSGCYGLNGADTVTYDAALLSQAVGKPVRVQLTRKDEMAWENYGNAFVMDERAGLDAQGQHHRVGSRSLVARRSAIGRAPALRAMSSPGRWWVSSPTRSRRGRPRPNRADSTTTATEFLPMSRRCSTASRKAPATVRSERVLVHNVPSPFWTGPLRSPARLQNTFAHESFMDELAAHAKADPVEYRLRHLSNQRVIDVLKAAAKAANWDARPSPQSGIPKTGVATGRGVACVAYEGDNGYTGIVAEVEVDQDTGKIAVKRIFVAIDAGPISNPDGLQNQAEGGALQGMSRALVEEVTWDDQKVTSIDWRTYHCLPLGFRVPKVECVLFNRPEEEATGAGETSITVIAAAIGNAIFDATGARLRQIPFTPERVKAALNARA